jgi:hypothetical protein
MNVNPDLIARFPYTSLEQVADPERFADLRASALARSFPRRLVRSDPPY